MVKASAKFSRSAARSGETDEESDRNVNAIEGVIGRRSGDEGCTLMDKKLFYFERNMAMLTLGDCCFFDIFGDL